MSNVWSFKISLVRARGGRRNLLGRDADAHVVGEAIDQGVLLVLRVARRPARPEGAAVGIVGAVGGDTVPRLPRRAGRRERTQEVVRRLPRRLSQLIGRDAVSREAISSDYC